MTDDTTAADTLNDDERFIARTMTLVAGEQHPESAAVARNALAEGRARLSRHRRRGAVAAVAAVVVLAGGTVAVRTVGLPGGGPAPVSAPSPSSGTPSASTVGPPVSKEVFWPGASLAWLVFAGANASVAGWDIGTQGPLLFAWTRTDDAWHTAQGLGRLNGPEGVEASNGDAFLWYGSQRLERLLPDGTTRAVTLHGRPHPARPGETLVGNPYGPTKELWAYDATTNTATALPGIPGLDLVSARWAGDGRLWVEGSADGSSVFTAWSDDGGRGWHQHRLAGAQEPGGLAVGNDGRVAAFGWTAIHQRIVRSRSELTTDNGRTWQPFDRGSGPQWVDSEQYSGEPGGVTQLPDGRIFVVDSGHRTLWTSGGDWSAFRRVRTPGPVSTVQSDGTRVWAIGASQGHGGTRVYVSSDGGATWWTITPR